jgi:hypothetical protein
MINTIRGKQIAASTAAPPRRVFRLDRDPILRERRESDLNFVLFENMVLK